MLEKVYQDRLAKLTKLRELGVDPYGARYDSAENISSVLDRFEAAEKLASPTLAPEAAVTGQSADTAGRVILYRSMGKLIFAHVRDHTEAMQVAFRKDALDAKTWEMVKLLDLGDIIAASGPLLRTRTGEVTIFADKVQLLTKSLLPMPEKFHGLQDVEIRYRQRYLDLMTNPESMAVFYKRIAIINVFRQLLAKRGFVEVETPILQAQYGGAAARPFSTHHNTLDADLFLRISPELYLKRLLVGGMAKVFEIGRNFRNEGIDTRHNPEFTMMELYQAYADYEVMMEITEELVSEAAKLFATPEARNARVESLTAHNKELGEAFKKIEKEIRQEMGDMKQTMDILDPDFQDKRFRLIQAKIDQLKVFAEIEASIKDKLEGLTLCGQLLDDQRVALEYGKAAIDFTPGWPKRKYEELLETYAHVSMRNPSAIRKKARSLGLEESNKDDAVVANDVFEAVVEPELAKPINGILRPTFVYDYPAAICPLTRRKADDPTIAMRFECYCGGMELANAYTELNDPAVQEENFRQQLKGEAANETMRVMDEDFVTALRHGMPPAGGLGIGIDRVVMLLTNSQSIRDVVLFPLLRPTTT